MKFVKKKIMWFLNLLFILTLFACGEEAQKVAVADNRPTVKVKLAKAGNQTIEGFTALSGKIQAEEYANISARIMGYLTNVQVQVGDKVRKGQVLATINSNELKAKQAQAEAGILEAKAGLKNIEKDFARIQSLFKKQSATQKELDDITTHRDMTLAKIKQAEEMKNEINTMLSYTAIKAPFNGIITEKHIHSGDMANPGRPLFTIEATGDFQAQVRIPENLFTQISKGDKVKVIIKSNNKELSGTVGEMSRSSVNTGGQYLTKINLDKKELKDIQLYSGMYLRVLFPQKSENKAVNKVMIDKDALVYQGQLTGIYTPSANKTALLRWVRLGKNYENQVEVLSGLSLGEDYIAEAEGRLMNGVKIEY